MSGKIIVVPDLHVPYHDRKNWDLLLQVIRREKPEKTIIIGDFADFYSVSSHSKDPRRKDRLEDEVAQVNDELDRIPGDVVFLEGNHEDRLRRYLQDKAPELFGICDVKRLFKLKERGWKHLPYRDYYRIGKVTFCHDVGRSGKYSAFQTLQDLATNVVFGHTHRGGVVYMGEAGPRGKPHFCLNVGWLGDVSKVDYMHRARAERDWQQGFGLLHTDRDRAHAQFIPIVGGRCNVNGRWYK